MNTTTHPICTVMVPSPFEASSCIEPSNACIYLRGLSCVQKADISQIMGPPSLPHSDGSFVRQKDDRLPPLPYTVNRSERAALSSGLGLLTRISLIHISYFQACCILMLVAWALLPVLLSPSSWQHITDRCCCSSALTGNHAHANHMSFQQACMFYRENLGLLWPRISSNLRRNL